MPNELPTTQVLEWLFGLAGGVISLLLLGNLFFLKKLIHKVDMIDPLIINIANLAKRLDELCSRVDLIHELRIEVAAMKARFNALIARDKEIDDSDVSRHSP